MLHGPCNMDNKYDKSERFERLKMALVFRSQFRGFQVKIDSDRHN